MDKLKEEIEKQIETLVTAGVGNNVTKLGMLVDIHKDLANEEYWKNKKEVMEMRYNDYGRRYRGDYEGDYGRRGRRRYRGEDMIDELNENYMNYSDAQSEVFNGNYGAESDMEKSVEGIMKNICKIVEELGETGSPEVAKIIKKHIKKMEETL